MSPEINAKKYQRKRLEMNQKISSRGNYKNACNGMNRLLILNLAG
jgi:hypothetical protein